MAPEGHRVASRRFVLSLLLHFNVFVFKSTTVALSFPFLSFPFLSSPLLSFPFLSFPFLSFTFRSLPKPPLLVRLLSPRRTIPGSTVFLSASICIFEDG